MHEIDREKERGIAIEKDRDRAVITFVDLSWAAVRVDLGRSRRLALLSLLVLMDMFPNIIVQVLGGQLTVGSCYCPTHGHVARLLHYLR